MSLFQADPSSRPHGFTLIEVLVALAITAIALGAGLKAAGSLTNNADRLSQVNTAQSCAENQLSELRLTHTFPNVGDSPFDCQQTGLQLAGHLLVQSTPNPNFRRVDAQVSDSGGQPLLTISTIVGQY